METKDFSHDCLTAYLIEIINYDNLLLNIEYPTGMVLKECNLFRVNKPNISDRFATDLLKHLNSLLKIGDKIKIRILDERRVKSDKTKELIIVFSNDGKHNINDQLLRYVVEYNDKNKMTSMIENIRLHKLMKE